MTKLDKNLLRTVSVFGLGIALSACGSSRTVPPIGAVPTPAPVIAAARQEDQFGTQFGVDFRVDLNGEPIPCKEGDLVAVSLTTEPVNIT